MSTAVPAFDVSAAQRDGDVLRLPGGDALALGDSVGPWTLMAFLDDTGFVLENFADSDGSVVVRSPEGGVTVLGKSAVSSAPSPRAYLGYSLEEVLHSETDILGRRVLEGHDDPDPALIADALPPIRRMPQSAFVGTPFTADKVVFEQGGRSPIFDPAAIASDIATAREDGRVLEGIVGGSLLAMRFVYPDADEDGCWEYIAFAPLHAPHLYVQPVWHRLVRIEGGRPVRVEYFDSYVPTGPADDRTDGSAFFADLLALHLDAERFFADGLSLDLPDPALIDQAQHALLRARATRVDGFPKYGVMDRLYGATEHDGFQDTFNAETTALLEWGLFDAARQTIDNYLTHFVKDDGSIRYRGPQFGQYGRMLTTIGDYVVRSRDTELLRTHLARVLAICGVLRELRRDALREDPASPSFGMIRGWCEADSCLEKDPELYRQPYLSNTAEAVRGFIALSRALKLIGEHATASELLAESSALQTDLDAAIARSIMRDEQPPHLPVIAGASEPFHVAVARDGAKHPQFRAYRANMELLFSGVLDSETAGIIVDYREAHRDFVLGMPCAYGYTYGPDLADNSPEIAGFLSYGHAYGLLQHGRVREFLLAMYGLAAHQYTRGTWTAPETRLIDPTREIIGYAVPAEVVLPMLLRWMLVFEEPLRDELRIAPGVPRDWLEHGELVSVDRAPTRWGATSYRITSRVDEGSVDVELSLPEDAPRVLVALRLPRALRAHAVDAPGAGSVRIDESGQALILEPGAADGLYRIHVA